MWSFAQYLTELALTLEYHDTLNPKLWKGGVLDPKIVAHLVDVAHTFAKYCGVEEKRIKDIVFTGSNANYNFNKYSDIDVHLITDEHGLDGDKIYDKKVLWTKNNPMKVVGYPVEFFCQDEKLNLPPDQGVYSLLHNKWLNKPKHLNGVERILNSQPVEDKVEQYVKIIKDLLKTPIDEDKIRSFKMRMWKERTAGLHRSGVKGGEFSIENIVYKNLRNMGYVDKLNKCLHIEDE